MKYTALVPDLKVRLREVEPVRLVSKNLSRLLSGKQTVEDISETDTNFSK